MLFKKLAAVLLAGGIVLSSIGQVFAYTQDDIQTVIDTAYQELNKPYVFGSSPYDNSSHDCSSLAMYCYSKIGVDWLERCSVNQAEQGQEVAYEDILPGDLVMMHTSDRNGKGKTSHVAIYVGDGKLIEARGRAYGVVITNLEDRKPIITTIRRIVEVEPEVTWKEGVE